MKHFRGIDGLRGWLASIVVIGHVFTTHGIPLLHPRLKVFQNAADFSVQVFIIISGFVITHLLVSKREPYLPYITRRFLRIYPVYLVCLIAGICTTYLAFDSMLPQPWGPLSPPTSRMLLQADSLAGNGFIAHLIAHLTLLHGMIGSNLLYESQYMFLNPAWSLSLEWQFYLVAPLIMWAIASRPWRIALAAICLAGFYLYVRGRLGDFALPSILPGAAPFFAAGIGTRLLMDKLPRPGSYPIATMIFLVGIASLGVVPLPFVAWIAFIAWMLAPRDSRVDVLFDSKGATWLGHRSYALYLIHLPVLQALMWMNVEVLHIGLWQSFAMCMVVCPAIALATAAALHRFVEQPAIRYGKGLFINRRQEPATQRT